MRACWSCVIGLVGAVTLGMSAASAQSPVEYLLLATSKTSTMQKEMNEAAYCQGCPCLGGRCRAGALLLEGATEAEVVVRVQHSEGRVRFAIPASIRRFGFPRFGD